MVEQFKTREIEILHLMAQELTNREIAERLHIGVETVRWYAKQIYSKLHVSGREQAAEKALELGLLDQEIESTGQSAEKSRHNLPSQFTPLIGREAVIASILEMVSETRLLTLTGVGGTGKTRLALRIGEEMLSQFRHGVTFVDLASIRNPDRVPNLIAETLDVFDSGNAPVVEILKRALADQHLLLILDNFEHVLDAVPVVTELLGAAPRLKILTTSREALRLSGEQIYDVPPLSLPPDNNRTLEALEQSEAVTLFVQRAQNVRSKFQLTQSNANDVVTICQRLDGLPLAIELAAASSRLLSPAAIVEHLDDRFRVLRSGSRDAPQRHQTLRATIDWSYSLLEADEKRLLARLAVFQGGCSLAAIEAVCSHDLSIDILDGMVSLVDKSLVRLEEDFSGLPRFILLETIYEYALERLQESGETEDVYRRHAGYFVEFAEANPSQWWYVGTKQSIWRIATEIDNLRVALNWTFLNKEAEWGLRIVFALDSFWIFMGHHAEGQRWVDHALQFLDDVSPFLRARILLSASMLGLLRQKPAQIQEYGTQALALFQELDEKKSIGLTMSLLAFAEIGDTDDYSKAITLAETGLANVRDEGGEIYSLSFHVLVILLNLSGEYRQAEEVSLEWMKNSQKGAPAFIYGQMGVTALGKQDYDSAEESFKQAIKIFNDFGLNYYLASNLKRMAVVYSYRGRFIEATRLLSATETYLSTVNMVWHADEQLQVNETLSLLKENMDDLAFQTAWEEGSQILLDEAVAFALQEVDTD